MYLGSDEYPYTVISVSPKGGHVVARRCDEVHKDGRVLFVENPARKLETFTRRGHSGGGHYVLKGHGCGTLHFGERATHRCPEF